MKRLEGLGERATATTSAVLYAQVKGTGAEWLPS